MTSTARSGQHPFPDEDTLGLPRWCPRGATRWPVDQGHRWESSQWDRARILAARSYTLTPIGRQFVATHHDTIFDTQQWTVDDHTHDEILAHAGLPLRSPDDGGSGAYAAPASLPWILKEMQAGRVMYPLGHIVQGIDALDPTTASDLILPAIAGWGKIGASQTDLLVRASLTRRLPWTTEAPPWWPDILQMFLHEPAFSHPCVHLPPALFPLSARLRWITQDYSAMRAVDILFHPDAGLEETAVLLDRKLRGDAARRLVTHLRHRHDLPTLLPELLPMLLGHTEPAYAELGLELTASMGARSRAP
jgi:hypothetical protein